MADDAGQPQPDLRTQAPETGFFELLRQLETDTMRFGRGGGPKREPARLGQNVRLAFATSDLAAFVPEREGHPPRVDVQAIGLLGPEGPMPLHLTRWVFGRLSERWFEDRATDARSDTTFLDFCNMLQHRMIAFYWRAWGDARPEVQATRRQGGRSRAMLGALAGIGLPGLGAQSAEAQGRTDALKLAHATTLASQVHGVERLTRYMEDVIGAPVRLVEFLADWVEIPPHLQTRMGRAHAVLGRSAVAGRRCFQRQDRAELRIGPLDLAGFTRLAEDPGLRKRLSDALLFTMGRAIDFDLRLVLARDEVPPGRIGQARLGRNGWLAAGREGRADDAADLRFSRITRSVGTAG